MTGKQNYIIQPWKRQRRRVLFLYINGGRDPRVLLSGPAPSAVFVLAARDILSSKYCSCRSCCYCCAQRSNEIFRAIITLTFTRNLQVQAEKKLHRRPFASLIILYIIYFSVSFYSHMCMCVFELFLQSFSEFWENDDREKKLKWPFTYK